MTALFATFASCRLRPIVYLGCFARSTALTQQDARRRGTVSALSAHQSCCRELPRRSTLRGTASLTVGVRVKGHHQSGKPYQAVHAQAYLRSQVAMTKRPGKLRTLASYCFVALGEATPSRRYQVPKGERCLAPERDRRRLERQVAPCWARVDSAHPGVSSP